MAIRHCSLSFTASCQLVIPERSLLMTSIHHKVVPPGFLFLPCGLHFISCFCGQWSGILCRWPNHRTLLCLNCSSNGNFPVSFRMSSFFLLSHRVTPTIALRDFIWKACSLLMSCWLAFQVLAPYRRTDIWSPCLGFDS